MTLAKITMDADEAMNRYRAYEAMDPDRRTPEDAAAMRGFKALADGKELVDLVVAMRDAGVDDQGMPRLAIARADQERIRFDGNRSRGSGLFYPPGDAYRRAGASLKTLLPPGTFDAEMVAEGWRSRDRYAFLPTIPPEHRPAPEHLKHYHVLWEALWVPQPPVDPFLLRHLTGTLYVVLAQWDLTEFERAVLRGRIQREEAAR